MKTSPSRDRLHAGEPEVAADWRAILLNHAHEVASRIEQRVRHVLESDVAIPCPSDRALDDGREKA